MAYHWHEIFAASFCFDAHYAIVERSAPCAIRYDCAPLRDAMLFSLPRTAALHALSRMRDSECAAPRDTRAVAAPRARCRDMQDEAQR